ncbi:MAG TPA: tripartite tricarboxylate transporter substrate binding protein [Burkholderiales bacterium]|nr:tripartite tricarboxylate transporter substrate binding protein [Burkholderiales bacterium]
MKRYQALMAIAALAAMPALAQQYPTKPIRYISPYPAGGGNDTLLRILADKVGEQMGQRIIVDNRPGANTIVGTELMVKSPPDGYTFLLIPNTFATNPAFYPKLPYDTVKDVTPVAQVALSPQMIVAHPSFPAKTVKELLAMARTKPGALTYGTSGTGSIGHLAGLLLTSMTGVTLTHVPYKGTAPAVNDLMGGHIPLMVSSMISTLPQVRNGRLKIIALTTAHRAKALPDVPTIAESGVPGYDCTLWYGILAPARTPEAIVRRMNAELGTALKSPDVVEKLSTQAVEPHHTSPEQFAALIRNELGKWDKVIRTSGVKLD